MNIKPADRAEMEVLKDLVAHLKATLLDLDDTDHTEHDAQGGDPGLVVELEGKPLGDHVGDDADHTLDMPADDNELDTGENLDGEDEDEFDLHDLFRLKK